MPGEKKRASSSARSGVRIVSSSAREILLEAGERDRRALEQGAGVVLVLAAARAASTISASPHCGLDSKRARTWTIVPGAQASKSAGTSSKAFAPTVFERSLSFSESHSPPRFVGRRLRSRTT